LISLVLVSHSRTLVEGLRDMVAQVAGDDVRVTTAGGTGDGRLGTSAPLITEALLAAIGGPDGRADGVLVLLDLGSAALSLELALEELDPRAVESSVGSSLDDVERAAAGAMSLPKMPKA
jgi:dihydroxyacetone kinase DhaKLM complex PTS-EIIA-like component DhaM